MEDNIFEKLVKESAKKMDRKQLEENFLDLFFFHDKRTEMLKREFYALREKYGKNPVLRRLWNIIQGRQPENNGLYFTEDDAKEWGVEWKEPVDVEDEE